MQLLPHELAKLIDASKTGVYYSELLLAEIRSKFNKSNSNQLRKIVSKISSQLHNYKLGHDNINFKDINIESLNKCHSCISIAKSSVFSALAYKQYSDRDYLSSINSLNKARKIDNYLNTKHHIETVKIHYWQTVHNFIRVLIKSNRIKLANYLFKKSLSKIHEETLLHQGDMHYLLQIIGFQLLSHYLFFVRENDINPRKATISLAKEDNNNHFQFNILLWNSIAEKNSLSLSTYLNQKDKYYCPAIAQWFL